MKQLIFTLLFALAIKASFAQTPDTLTCDAPDRDTTTIEDVPWFGNNDYLENFLDSIGYPASGIGNRIIGPERVRYHVPIKFWVYRSSAGVGGPTDLQLRDYIDNLNRLYNVDNNTLIGFYMKCDVEFINDDDHLEVGDLEAWLLIQSHKTPGAINIHITDNLKDAAGVHYRARFFGVDAIFLSAATYTRPDLAATIAHEVGHYFELDHTHQFSDAGRCRKEAIDRNRTWPFFNVCFSRLRSSKVCEATGDLLRDTPADHDLNSNFSCNYIVTGQTDPWGDHYETPPSGSSQPDTRNILSYNGFRGCRSIFSRLQIAVMLHSIERGKSSGNRSQWSQGKTEYDSYEPDNNSVMARPILFGEVQARNFHQQHEGNNFWYQCDVDWARFVSPCNATLNITTSPIGGRNNANTRLTLFDASLVQLAQNDNISTGNLYSQIPFTFVAGQTYFIRVENMLPYPGAYNTGYYNLLIGNAPIAATAEQLSCNEIQFSVSGNNGTVYNWSVNYGDILFNGATTTAVTTTPTIYATGTTGSVSVTATNACGVVESATVGYEPFARNPLNIPNPMIHGDHLSVSVNTTPYDTYYRWYVNGFLVKEGAYATNYCTCYYEGQDQRQCGTNTVRVEVDNCTSTSFYEEQFDWICGYGRMQSNVELFPNPARDQVTVRLKQINDVNPNNKLVEIRALKVLDKLGSVKRVIKYPPKTNAVNLNLSMLQYDIYYIEVSDGKHTSRLPLSIHK